MQRRLLITPNARENGGIWHVSDASGYVAAGSVRGEVARILFPRGSINHGHRDTCLSSLEAQSSIPLALHPVSKRAMKAQVSSTRHCAHRKHLRPSATQTDSRSNLESKSRTLEHTWHWEIQDATWVHARFCHICAWQEAYPHCARFRVIRGDELHDLQPGTVCLGAEVSGRG